MLDKVANILLNPKFVNFANNTKYTVSTESIFKATGRPAAIMMDKNVDEDTRKYAATKEGLYQMLCLGIYLTMIPFIFQRYGFKIAQRILKGDKELPAFKDAQEYLNYAKLAKMNLEERKNSKLLSKISDTLKADKDDKLTLKEHLLKEEKPPEFPAAKGAIELSNLTGTVIGLAWIASELSNHILHPLMRGLGFEEKKKQNCSKINIKA
ncbi:TPA: hypothetical protein IAD41_01380 [Candidatus Scatenecus faecavium]|uniref:Uncharacterized protein n=1 Tax=Candidatus Scatenecus faecavium TaxID=2840915 RepID=A0A9D1FUM8_9BACT|nr:hypothetical protein [Candidatus Scatenecus faecavium]